MAASFPPALKSFTNPTSTNKLNSPSHSTQHTGENDEITAIETYLGTNASQTTPVAAGKVLNSTSASAATWTAAPTLGVAGTTIGQITLAGNTSGSTVVQPTAAASGTLTLPAATDTLVGKATTDTLTNKTLTSPTLTTPVLGTPSSGTLTNCSGLPVSGITASTTTALGVGSIELGHATDTTIARVSAGVASIEGVNVVTTSSTDTLTNKTLTTPTIQQINSTTNNPVKLNAGFYSPIQTYTPGAGGTATLDLSLGNIHHITMPAGNITIALSNATTGQCFMVRILQDSVGSRTVTWFTTIKWAGGSAPTLTTTANKADTLGFEITGTNTYDGFVVGANI